MSNTVKRSTRRTAAKLALVALGMFGFGYGLALSYDTLCRVLGVGGKTGRLEAQAPGGGIDAQRTVIVEFTGNAAAGLPWEFAPRRKRLQVHPGEIVTVSYSVRNTAAEVLTGQAVPSVTPAAAGAHFKKIECFCFTQQQLQPGEARDMPVRFVVEPGLAADVQTITLSYAFFNVDKLSAAKYGGVPGAARKHAGAHAHTGG
jgi:cytochrome c oxidase assembly protein subunit 11